MRGQCPAYWNIVMERWRERAFICRMAHQSIYHVMRRDPVTEPLSMIEWTLFAVALVAVIERDRRTQGDIPQLLPEET